MYHANLYNVAIHVCCNQVESLLHSGDVIAGYMQAQCLLHDCCCCKQILLNGSVLGG